jgi:hypothetical protein
MLRIIINIEIILIIFIMIICKDLDNKNYVVIIFNLINHNKCKQKNMLFIINLQN